MNDEADPRATISCSKLLPTHQHKQYAGQTQIHATVLANPCSRSSSAPACTASVGTTNHGLSLFNAISRRSRSCKTSAVLVARLPESKKALINFSRCCRYHLPLFAQHPIGGLCASAWVYYGSLLVLYPNNADERMLERIGAKI